MKTSSWLQINYFIITFITGKIPFSEMVIGWRL